jgi:hypothetical protein
MKTTLVSYACGMLQFEPDSSPADWFTQRDEPWEQLVTMGPTGFESYARVHHLDEDRISQGVLYGRLRVYLADDTKTPEDCFHALWDGSVSSMYGDALRGTSPWFPAGVLNGPKLRVPPGLPIPARQYLLFRGPLDEIGHWGARELTTGSPKDGELPAPHLLWPGDHRWFVATDVDSDFTWVGGSQGLIGAMNRDPKLRAELVHRL